MPATDSFEFDYIPGYTKTVREYGTPFGDEFHAEVVQELLLSMAGYTQRGVTLAGGQGVLPTGTVLAKHAASGRYFAYLPTATDGRQLPLGVLRDGRDTGGTGYTTGALYNASALAVADAITLAPATAAGGVFPASVSGKAGTDCLANLVWRGLLNANIVSGADTASLVSGTGGGIGTATLTALGARIAQFGGSLGTAGAFPGGPMDGQTAVSGVNAFIF